MFVSFDLNGPKIAFMYLHAIKRLLDIHTLTFALNLHEVIYCVIALFSGDSFEII